MAIKKLFSETILILFISVMLSLLVNGFRPDGIRLFSNNTVQNKTDDAEGVKEISIEVSIQMFEDGNTLFADARSADDYAAGHIKGALNLPEYEFDNWVDDFLSQTDPSTKIITYCDGINCELGKNLAEKLYLLGFENVFYVVNGWSRWVEHSQPIESGT